MKFIKLVKSTRHDEFLKNTYKDYNTEENAYNHRFNVKITKDGYLQITMIKPYSMQERWPWAISQKPLAEDDYEFLDETGDFFGTDFNIYQVPKNYMLHHPQAKLVDTIKEGTVLDVCKKLAQLSEGLDYQVDRT